MKKFTPPSRRPKLGQNFLVDTAWQNKIVSLFAPEAEFGEIGPGRGALTQLLVEKWGSGFVVFEKDRELAANHRANNSYQVVEGDFLDWDFCAGGKPVENYSLIGNLPYESGTAMVLRCVEKSNQLKSFLFLLQKEVVERIAASPRTRDFGSLSVFVQGAFDVKALDVIPPSAFSPPPKVQSQLVLGHRRPVQSAPRDPKFERFVQWSFSQKRKILKNTWKARFSPDQIDKMYQAYSFSPDVRAEQIPVDLWAQIYREWVV